MNLIDMLLCLVILAAVCFAVRAVVRARKNGGGCGGCTGDCASCGKPQAQKKNK